MSRAAPLAALLAMTALAGCAPPMRDPGCARVADNDPAVYALEMKVLGNPVGQAQVQPELNAARARAVTACLRARGEAPPGGVEAPPRTVGRF